MTTLEGGESVTNVRNDRELKGTYTGYDRTHFDSCCALSDLTTCRYVW